MCDTQVIRHGGSVWLAKNSDREPDEPQLVVRTAPVRGDRAAVLRATWIEIPQSGDRHGTLLSKPCWMWGAEMGVNDRGVAIGNEAVFTRAMERAPGLIGMDLLRLGLERGADAREAMEVITGHLERWGQGGRCGFRDRRFRYDNSFLLADPSEAWVLETAGRHWAAARIGSFGAISNCLTLGTEFSIHSAGLHDFARDRGWWDGRGALHFARTFDTWLLPHFGRAHRRLEAAHRCLARDAAAPSLGWAAPASNLRAHAGADSDPARGSNADLCMHAAGPIRRSQTTGSMIVRWSGGKRRPQPFFTGTSAPCLSIFRPAGFDPSTAFSVLNRDESTVEGSLWLAHEAIHHHLLFDADARAELQARRVRAEADLWASLEAQPEPDAATLARMDRIAVEWAENAERHRRAQPTPRRPWSAYRRFWDRVARREADRDFHP